MKMLKDYLNKNEIEIVSKRLNISIQDIEVYESFTIEETYEGVLESLYDDEVQEFSEEEFLSRMDNVFKFECGYIIIWS